VSRALTGGGDHRHPGTGTLVDRGPQRQIDGVVLERLELVEMDARRGQAVELGGVGGQHPEERPGDAELEVADDDVVGDLMVHRDVTRVLGDHPGLIAGRGGDVDRRALRRQEVVDGEGAGQARFPVPSEAGEQLARSIAARATLALERL
jgi:hypothetical protein